MLLRKVVGFVLFAASRICWQNHSKVVLFFFSSTEVVPPKLLLYSYICMEEYYVKILAVIRIPPQTGKANEFHL